MRAIYHNIRYRHPPQPVQRDPDGCLAKPATNHPENRPDRAGFIFYHLHGYAAWWIIPHLTADRHREP
ncbi:hypothetical protein Q1B75_004918 [Salmonella enterica]